MERRGFIAALGLAAAGIATGGMESLFAKTLEATPPVAFRDLIQLNSCLTSSWRAEILRALPGLRLPGEV